MATGGKWLRLALAFILFAGPGLLFNWKQPVTLAWIGFRSPTLELAGQIGARMVTLADLTHSPLNRLGKAVPLLLLGLLTVDLWRAWTQRVALWDREAAQPWVAGACLALAFLLAHPGQPFLYFRF